MSETKEYEVEIEFEGRLFISVQATTAEQARTLAERYNPKAEEVRVAVERFVVDPWERLED